MCGWDLNRTSPARGGLMRKGKGLATRHGDGGVPGPLKGPVPGIELGLGGEGTWDSLTILANAAPFRRRTTG